MGNTQSNNDDFSRNPNFNIQNHNQAMQSMQANYSNPSYSLNNPHMRPPIARATQTQFKSIRRTASIYKPSISIHAGNDTIKIQCKYDSDQGNRLEVYIGVNRVEEDQENKVTLKIQSVLFYEELLQGGQKQSFQKEYPLKGFNRIKGSTIILRILSLSTDERTEYSIKNTGTNIWKILLQKFQKSKQVTQLDNIYKGGNQADQCIICFSQKVNTLIEPCNHLCLCYQCCQQVRRSTNTCPICRNEIRGFKKIRSTA